MCWKMSATTRPRTSNRRSTCLTPTAGSCEEIKRYAVEHEQRYGRFPKTLIFAANDLPHSSHADQLVGQARDIFGRGEEFVAKITGKVDRPLQRIREFRNRPNPGIVVSVDLMTTGVDIPDLEFIVLLRPNQVAHPVGADAGPRHPQGRKVYRQEPFCRI